MKKIIAIVGVFVAMVSTASAAYFDTTPLYQCQSHITSTLQFGAYGTEVYTLQQALFDAGFLSVVPNGYFGNQTVTAVKAFQADNGIRTTGVVGPSTRNAINEGLCDTSTTGVTIVTPFLSTPSSEVVLVPSPRSPLVYVTPSSNSESYTSASYQNTQSPSSYQGIVTSGIVYNPQTGYTLGFVPESGQMTVYSPLQNDVYNEGDTVSVRFSTDKLATSLFSVILESAISGQSKTLTVTTSNSYSFVLTKELLDSVCSGACNSSDQGSFRVVVTTPITDLSGTVTTLRATVAPITIKRPYTYQGQVTVTASKTPVTSGEVIKLYVNTPFPSRNDATPSLYTLKLTANCTPLVSVSIAGTLCGQDFVMPVTQTAPQQEIPVRIINTSWYNKEVTFTLSLVNALGQSVASSKTTVTVNPAPFSW